MSSSVDLNPLLPIIQTKRLAAMPFLIEILLPFLKKTAKYWIAIAICLSLGLYAHHKYETFVDNIAKAAYDKGYADAEAKYKTELATQALQYQATQVRLQQQYNAEIAKAIDDTNKAIAKAQQAEKVAETNLHRQKTQNSLLQQQLNEAKKHVQLSSNDINHPFTRAFVGLFNIATKNNQLPYSATSSSSSGNITTEDIYKAGFFVSGPSSVGLAQPAETVSVADVLNAVQANMKIANQCMDERNQLRKYIDDLCNQGFCQ